MQSGQGPEHCLYRQRADFALSPHEPTPFSLNPWAQIGVASTKAFTTQLVALFLLAVTLGRARGHVDREQEATYRAQLGGLSTALQSVLAREPQIIAWGT